MRSARAVLILAGLVAALVLLPKDPVDRQWTKWSKCPAAVPATSPDCVLIQGDKSRLRQDIEGRLRWLGLPHELGALIAARCHAETIREDRTDDHYVRHGGILGPEQHEDVRYTVCDYRL